MGHFEPMMDRSINKLELVNESLLMILNYHLLSFSDFNTDEGIKHYLGYGYLIVIGLIILVNVVVIINKAYLRYQRRRHLYRLWKLREKLALDRMRQRFQGNKRLVSDIRNGRFIRVATVNKKSGG